MTLLTYPKFQAPDVNGVNLSGGLVYFYITGTTTPKDTYSDEALSVVNANPVVLDDRGEADIYLNGEYKIILKTSADVEIWTVDSFTGYALLEDLASTDSGKGASLVKFESGSTVQDLASTTTDDTDGGFHLVNFPPLSGETGVVNYEYEYATAQRHDVPTDGSDASPNLRNACDSALALGIGRVTLESNKRYTCSTPLYNSESTPEGLWLYSPMPPRPIGGAVADGTTIMYTGAGLWFDIQEANGVDEVGGLRFTNIIFRATNAAGGMFQFNDVTDEMTNDNTSPNIIREIIFEHCNGNGPGADVATGNFIQALGTFELVIDRNCYINNWKRGVYLKGCDNCTIEARILANTRGIQIETSATFGNDALISSRFIRPKSVAGQESRYCVYDEGNHTILESTNLEILASGPVAGIYLNGLGTRLSAVDFEINSVPGWEVGPDAVDIVFMSPKTSGSMLAPIVAEQTSYSTGSPFNYDGVTITDPSDRIEQLIVNVPRHRISQSTPRRYNPLSRIGHELITSNGIAQKKFVFSPANYGANTTTAGWAEINGIVTDTDSYLGVAVQLDNVNTSGYTERLIVGTHLHEGDTVKLTFWYKHEDTPASGNYRYVYMKNGVDVSNGALAVSATYTSQSTTYTLSGYSNGDTFDVGVFNNAVTDYMLNVALIMIELVDPANADTSGATLGQLETEVNELKATLRNFGLIG